jgi:UDP-N-acetylglucosamine/UDP-N-acetylgalactosamine diphosphorylase
MESTDKARAQRLLRERGQEHLLAFWDKLTDDQRCELLAETKALDFGLLDRLIESHVRRRPGIVLPDQIDPPQIIPHTPDDRLVDDFRRATGTGEDLLRRGKVAAFTVAGGQGTRLGFDGPKGALAITPVEAKSLFQLFAESIAAVGAAFEATPPWCIMTSSANHRQTIDFFEDHHYFGLLEEDVIFFQQGEMPAFSPEGKILLAERHRIALSPDGHGGCLTAMANHGVLDELRRRGVEHISYFQVDNPLVKPLDPLFLGLHHARRSEMSSKAVAKADDHERVGNFFMHDGKTAVIEYSDLPPGLAEARYPDGSRLFDAANIAVHILTVEFVERLTIGGLQLPWRRAEKKVSHLDPQSGCRIDPNEPNSVKLETFVFDALPLAKAEVGTPLILQTRRDEEFSPVKNATGVDSVETAKRDLNRRAARWLAEAGVDVPSTAEGEPDGQFEIDPRFARDVEELSKRIGGQKISLERRCRFYLSARGDRCGYT